MEIAIKLYKKACVIAKKYRKTLFIILGILILAVLIAIPFIINESYKTNSGYLTLWGAEDVLNFYGIVLSFVGTAALGALALYQNMQANSINKRLSLIEKERFKLELQPFVLVTNWKIEIKEVLEVIFSPQKIYIKIEHNQIESSKCLCLSIFFTNTSNSYVLVNYSSAEVYYNDTFIEDWSHSTSNQQNEKLYLKSGDTGEIVFYCSKEKMISFRAKKIKLSLLLENRFSERYKETIDIIIPQLFEMDNIPWQLYLSPQNYQIEKFIKQRNGQITLEDI